jgi:hypothetical protein
MARYCRSKTNTKYFKDIPKNNECSWKWKKKDKEEEEEKDNDSND